MTTRFKTAVAGGVAAILLAGAAPALMAAAQDAPQQRRERRGPGGPGMGGPMRGPGMAFGPEFRYLELNDDQRAQLRKSREARQAEFREAGEKIRAARQGLRTLLEADQINEQAIRAQSAAVAAAEADVAILNAKVRQESLQILTAEQQQKLKELRDARAGQTKQRRGPRGQ